jgi:hypothetical protein
MLFPPATTMTYNKPRAMQKEVGLLQFKMYFIFHFPRAQVAILYATMELKTLY